MGATDIKGHNRKMRHVSLSLYKQMSMEEQGGGDGGGMITIPIALFSTKILLSHSLVKID